LATLKAPQTIYLIKDSNDASHRQIKDLQPTLISFAHFDPILTLFLLK